MNKITISATHIIADNARYNLQGNGKTVATINSDDINPIINSKDHAGADMIELDGVVWCIRDILAMAERGENGLTLA